MNSKLFQTSFFVLIGFLCLLSDSEAFYYPGYYLPISYQRYMDENQAVLRNLMASVSDKSHLKEENPPITEESTATVTTKSVAPPPEIMMPRRDQRQYFFSPQFKRMRPCFYSPIQCLMKRSEQEA